MSKTGRAKSLKQRIANYRLTVASVTLSNLAHTALSLEDMRNACHIGELCDQYSLLILLNVIATKRGFPVCTQPIKQQQKIEARLPLLSWLSLVDRYPLQIYGDLSIIFKIYEKLIPVIEQSFHLDLELIGAVYQQCISAPLAISEQGQPYIDLKSDARSGGEFYTPAWVGDYAFEHWLNADSDCLLPRLKAKNNYVLPHILDPSCGTGNFLLAALRMAERLGLSLEQQIEFAGQSLYGRDIDGRAVEISKLLVLISLSKCLAGLTEDDATKAIDLLYQRLDHNISISDSLLLSLSNASVDKFDLVITNPPYISFGSRDQQQISSQWQKMLKQRFPASSEYKLRYTSIFQEIGMELSCQPAKSKITTTQNFVGQCIFLVPDAFLTGSYYQKLRNLILEKVEIAGLSELPSSTIGDATVGRWCLAHFRQKDEQRKTESKQTINLYDVSCGHEGAISLPFQIPLSALVSRDRQRFQLLFSKIDLEIMLLCKNFAWLSQVLKGHTGIRSRNGQSSIISTNKMTEFHLPGLISGGELRPFSVEWRGNWLELQAKNLYAGGFDPNIISGPKILLRQTGDSLVAAVDNTGLYHLNNVHSFVTIDSQARHNRLYFYTCLLNSSFYLYFYRMKTREHKRALAQIDIETVEHMPLPPSNLRIEAELEDLGRLISKTDFQNRAEMLARMNQLVFQLFGLTVAMQKHVTLTTSATKQGKTLEKGAKLLSNSGKNSRLTARLDLFKNNQV